jgi:hypothetical protein
VPIGTGGRATLARHRGGGPRCPFLTLAFTGLTQTVTANNVRRPFAVGVISQTLTGAGPFLFPATRQPFPNVYDPTFTFGVTLAGVGTRRYGFNVAAPSAAVEVNCCDFYPTTFTYGGPSPTPFRYTGVVAEDFTRIQFRADGSPLEISATVGIIPEPTTLALAGLGILLTAAAARRSRR